MSYNPGIFKASMGAVFRQLLPSRMKRLVFVISLAAKVRKGDALEIGALAKLNEIMDLCQSDKSMGLPVTLSEVIWKDRLDPEVEAAFNDDTDVPEATLSSIISRILERVPAALRYGSEEELKADIRTMFDHRRDTILH